jgi:hypothetical protein
VQLKPGVDYKSFEKKLPAFCYRYWPDHEWARLNNAKDALYMIAIKGYSSSFQFQPGSRGEWQWQQCAIPVLHRVIYRCRSVG